MAEVLGVVASGIAVAQLTNQIVCNIRNIHDFWKSVQGAPQNLRDTLEELQLLTDTLLELQGDLNNSNDLELPGGAARNCLQYCKKVADDLEAILAGLRWGIDGKKGLARLGAVKFAFQKRKLHDFQQRLERAKSMLTLAVSCYSMSYHRYSTSLALANIAITEKPVDEIPSQGDDLPAGLERNCKNKIVRQSRKYFSASKTLPLLGRLQYKSMSAPPRWRKVPSDGQIGYPDGEDVEVEYTFVPAKWTRLQALSFRTTKIYGAWIYTFKQFRIVPREQGAYYACRLGTIDDVIGILTDRSTSLYDVDEEGWNLLHWAASGSNSRICQWLIEQGIDSTAVNKDLQTPLHLLNVLNASTRSRACDTARVLVEHGQIDPMFNNRWGFSSLDQFAGDLASFKYLTTSQDQFYVNVLEQDAAEIAELMESIYRYNRHAAEISLYLLHGGIAQESLSWPCKSLSLSIDVANEYYLLSRTCERLGLHSQLNSSDLDTELSIVAELIRAGVDLHNPNEQGLTALDHLLSWQMPVSEGNLEHLVLVWMNCLHQCRVDLKHYWRAEEKLHENGRLIPNFFSRRNIDRVFELYYGAGQDDVTILVEDVWRETGDDYQIPGSWNAEEDYAEKYDLRLIEGESPSAFWSVTTSGFQYGDYSPERAGCKGMY